jgi:hypothetical protein
MQVVLEIIGHAGAAVAVVDAEKRQIGIAVQIGKGRTSGRREIT